MDQYAETVAARGLNNQIPLDQALDILRRRLIYGRSISAPVRTVPFVWQLPPVTNTPADNWADVPRLLVPANKNRMSLVIAQIQNPVSPTPEFLGFYNFGFPAMRASAGGGKTWGLIIPGWCITTTLDVPHLGPLGNGTISEDEVWVTVSKIGASGGTSPSAGLIIAYEGTLAVSSERNFYEAA